MLLFLVRVVEWLYVIGVISRSALLHSIYYEIDALCIYGWKSSYITLFSILFWNWCMCRYLIGQNMIDNWNQDHPDVIT